MKGEVKMEGKKTEVITFRVTPELYDQIKSFAALRGWTVSHWCEHFIRTCFARALLGSEVLADG